MKRCGPRRYGRQVIRALPMVFLPLIAIGCAAEGSTAEPPPEIEPEPDASEPQPALDAAEPEPPNLDAERGGPDDVAGADTVAADPDADADADADARSDADAIAIAIAGTDPDAGADAHSGLPGEALCGALASCFDGCLEEGGDAGACVGACLPLGTPQSQALLSAALACATEWCSEDADPGFGTCEVNVLTSPDACGPAYAACLSDGCPQPCALDDHCIDGSCEPLCPPECEGKSCGPNGCGGTCGSCGEGSSCSDQGLCVESEQPSPCADLPPWPICQGEAVLSCEKATGPSLEPCGPDGLCMEAEGQGAWCEQPEPPECTVTGECPEGEECVDYLCVPLGSKDATCDEVIACSGLCQGEPGCEAACAASAGGLEALEAEALGACLEAAACADPACTLEHCLPEATACTFTSSGPASCAELHACALSGDCPSPPCEEACGEKGASQAQAAWMALLLCLEAACPAEGACLSCGPCAPAALAEGGACHAPYEACSSDP